jgi:nucleotide-binding universal stress UspA family protein
MYDDILVPTDGSETATAALEHARQLAMAHDAAVHLLYVTEAAAIAPTPSGGEVLDRLREHGEQVIENAIDRIREDVRTVEGAVASGPPHRAILDYAEEHDVDLIMMGTHGRTGLSHVVLGSVTERVVRLSPVPVLTLRGEDVDVEEHGDWADERADEETEE